VCCIDCGARARLLGRPIIPEPDDMRHLGYAIAAVAVMTATAAGAAAQELQGCASPDPERRVAACTALIDAPDTVPALRSEAFFRRGLSYSQFNQYERAIRDYDAAIAITPGFAPALNNRAYSYLKLGKPSQGLPDVEEALEIEPLHPIFSTTRGEIRQVLGDRDGAIRDHEAAMASGGRPVVMLYQCSLRLARLYHGPLDGIIRPELRTALGLCVDQGAQCAPVPSFPDTECPEPLG
jgi:tetratricopeptide (TPR) repeat protein